MASLSVQQSQQSDDPVLTKRFGDTGKEKLPLMRKNLNSGRTRFSEGNRSVVTSFGGDLKPFKKQQQQQKTTKKHTGPRGTDKGRQQLYINRRVIRGSADSWGEEDI